MRVLVQLPEGLKPKAPEIVRELEEKGYEVILSASPMYGGCDIAYEEAKAVGAQKIIHVGHSYFPLKRTFEDIEVEYIPYHIDIEIGWPELVKELKSKNIKTLSVLTTVQHIHQFPQIKEYFEKEGFEVKVRKGPFCTYEGQVLGCDAYGIHPEAEAAVIIADGDFHHTAATHIAHKMPVYGVNPYTKAFSQVNEKLIRLLKRRRGSLLKALEAQHFGILVSTKPGQWGFKLALEIKKKLEARGKKAYILVGNELFPDSLYNYLFIEVYINTACPRIVDDVEKYKKPIINPDQLQEFFTLLGQDTQ
ncbi:MAG: diphthamide biosynthesis enzyme Dph2 [Candidatus Micrarchaeota archaeon]|nr:diphthamide biosynthesis enzyme Dph2 [Candidatus Micrarchaeota archaeon]